MAAAEGSSPASVLDDEPDRIYEPFLQSSPAAAKQLHSLSGGFDIDAEAVEATRRHRLSPPSPSERVRRTVPTTYHLSSGGEGQPPCVHIDLGDSDSDGGSACDGGSMGGGRSVAVSTVSSTCGQDRGWSGGRQRGEGPGRGPGLQPPAMSPHSTLRKVCIVPCVCAYVCACVYGCMCMCVCM